MRKLILTTAAYIIWPPTQKNFDTTRNEWTAQLRRGPHCSSLQQIEVRSASVDEGGRYEDWEEEEDTQAHPIEFDLGARWMWARKSKSVWASVVDNMIVGHGEEDFFSAGEQGTGLYGYYQSWLHLDEAEWAKECLDWEMQGNPYRILRA